MSEPHAADPVAAYARGCLAAARYDRDWFREAVAKLEAVGERIVQTEQPAKDGGAWAVLDWRTGGALAAIATHPHIRGVSGRTRIKQEFRQTTAPIDYRFPPKWRLPSERTAVLTSSPRYGVAPDDEPLPGRQADVNPGCSPERQGTRPSDRLLFQGSAGRLVTTAQVQSAPGRAERDNGSLSGTPAVDRRRLNTFRCHALHYSSP